MKGNVSVQHSSEPEKQTGEEITRTLKNLNNRPVLFLVSGGSALSVLEHIDKDVLGAQLTISMVDERLSKKPHEINFLQLKASPFYQRAETRGVRFIASLKEEDESARELSERWEKSLRDWKVKHKDGMVVALLGIGEDGHTAGIMPFPEDPRAFEMLFRSDRWVVSYDAGTKSSYPFRITTTLSFLEACVDYAFFFLKGESKASVLREVLISTDTAVHPGSIIHSMKRVVLFTDIADIGGKRGA